MPCIFEVSIVKREPILEIGFKRLYKPYRPDTYSAYVHAMALMADHSEYDHIKLAEDYRDISLGWYYEFTRDVKGIIRCFSVTPHFREEVTPKNISDYFRRPVYRRCAHV